MLTGMSFLPARLDEEISQRGDLFHEIRKG